MSVEPEKWARKDEADYVVSLSQRLGFRGELNNAWHFVYSCMFASKPWTSLSYSRSIPRQVAECRMESVLWQENGRASALVEKVCYYLTDL